MASEDKNETVIYYTKFPDFTIISSDNVKFKVLRQFLYDNFSAFKSWLDCIANINSTQHSCDKDGRTIRMLFDWIKTKKYTEEIVITCSLLACEWGCKDFLNRISLKLMKFVDDSIPLTSYFCEDDASNILSNLSVLNEAGQKIQENVGMYIINQLKSKECRLTIQDRSGWDKNSAYHYNRDWGV